MDWFKEKILPLRGKLLQYANGILGDQDEAEDIVQETLIGLWRDRAMLAKHPNIRSRAYVMTKNLALNRKKVLARKARSSVDNAGYEEPYAEPDDPADKAKAILKII